MQKRLCLYIVMVLALCFLAVPCRGAVWEARVVDADTGRPLPLASVRTDGGRTTITNAEGWFAVECDSLERVHVSFVGYSPAVAQAMAGGAAVRLRPMAVNLAEIVVQPVDKIVRAVMAEARRQMRKKRRHKATFFYRQTTFAGSECSEVLEAFFVGLSAVSLRDLSLQHGRYAALESDSLHLYSYFGNFFTYSQVEILGGSKPAYNQDVMPLVDNYRDYYDVSLRTVSDGERKLHVLRFRAKPEVERPVLDCELYVDSDTHHVLRCNGRGLNMRVLNKVGRRRTVVAVDSMVFEANYADSDGFSEVESVAVTVSLPSGGSHNAIRSLMYNVGSGKRRLSERRLWFNDNLQRTIDKQGYSARFWRDNEIVKRTPLEDGAVRLFEQRNLFGSF